MRKTILSISMILILALVGAIGCSSSDDSKPQILPVSTSDDWVLLNDWLAEFYGFPPVSNTTELQSAAMLASEYWFDTFQEAIDNLESNNIPWERTAPSVVSFHYWMLRETQLQSAQTPLEFLAYEELLVQSVEKFHNDADELIHQKELGENPRTFSSEKEAMNWFRELDPSWEAKMREAMERDK